MRVQQVFPPLVVDAVLGLAVVSAVADELHKCMSKLTRKLKIKEYKWSVSHYDFYMYITVDP